MSHEKGFPRNSCDIFCPFVNLCRIKTILSIYHAAFLLLGRLIQSKCRIEIEKPPRTPAGS